MRQKAKHFLTAILAVSLFALFTMELTAEEKFYLIKDSRALLAIKYTAKDPTSKEAQEHIRSLKVFNSRLKKLSGTMLPCSSKPEGKGKALLEFIVNNEKSLANI